MVCYSFAVHYKILFRSLVALKFILPEFRDINTINCCRLYLLACCLDFLYQLSTNIQLKSWTLYHHDHHNFYPNLECQIDSIYQIESSFISFYFQLRKEQIALKSSFFPLHSSISSVYLLKKQNQVNSPFQFSCFLDECHHPNHNNHQIHELILHCFIIIISSPEEVYHSFYL